MPPPNPRTLKLKKIIKEIRRETDDDNNQNVTLEKVKRILI